MKCDWAPRETLCEESIRKSGEFSFNIGSITHKKELGEAIVPVLSRAEKDVRALMDMALYSRTFMSTILSGLKDDDFDRIARENRDKLTVKNQYILKHEGIDRFRACRKGAIETGGHILRSISFSRPVESFWIDLKERSFHFPGTRENVELFPFGEYGLPLWPYYWKVMEIGVSGEEEFREFMEGKFVVTVTYDILTNESAKEMESMYHPFTIEGKIPTRCIAFGGKIYARNGEGPNTFWDSL
jgi:hypothetical protein